MYKNKQVLIEVFVLIILPCSVNKKSPQVKFLRALFIIY